MLTTRRLGALGVAIVTLVLIGLLAWRDSPPILASPGGLANPGFEDGQLGGLPVGWDVKQPVPDAVVVVGAEGPAQFPTYADMGGVTVTPFKGARMLRLGRPKKISESQNPNPNAVSQTFTSDASTIKFSFWLFSWEHRGRDEFRFDLRKANGQVVPGLAVKDLKTGNPLVVAMADGSTRTCGTIPCRFSIDAGKRGQFVNTGWMKVEIGNIPIGQSLTLTYSVGGTDDNAHATWAYFDNANTPPVAKFTFSPTEPWEGDFIQFEDLSYDLDPGDFIAYWEWVIEGMYGELFTFNTQNPFSIFPDEGIYDVTLTVTDSYGASNTVSAGGIATDGDPVPLVAAVNGPPLVNALNIEAVAGQEASLFGRFLDSGWLDSHSPPAANQATWTLNGDEFAAALEEDNIPALATGIATGQVTPAGDLEGTLEVWDEDGNSGSDSFQVTVVPDDPNSGEPNDTLADAPPLPSDSIYPAYIQSAGDVDVFELLSPDGDPLPADAQVLVTLSDLPADYDLVIVSQLPEGGPEPAPYLRSEFGAIGFESLPYLRSPYLRSPYLRSPYLRSPYLRSPYLRSPYLRSPYLRSEMTFDLYPLSEMGFTGLDGTEIGGTDIDLEELGLGAIDGENLKVAGFSASRGQEEERVLAVADFPGTRLFAVVVGFNEAHSMLPASLRVEMSVRLDLGAALNPEICDRSSLFDHSTVDVETLHAYSGTAQTLLVTQRERIISLYGQPAWDDLLSGLEALADDDAVRGDIISMPASLYADWDANACSVDAANDVAAAIRDEIQSRLQANPNIQYVVLVGSDDVIPLRRVADETVISNERDYLVDSFLKPGSPLFSSLLASKNLTDDYFVDGQPSPWQGRELYIPDLPIGRLVETPQEMQAAAAAFLASNGILDPSTGFVSGYDFFSDGSQITADNLAAELATDDSLIRDDWTADELRCRFLGQDGGGECAVPDVSAVNAHFTHYAALSADGFATNDFDDILSSDDVGASGDSDGVVFSMGCHAGLNVPDYAVDSDLGLGIDPALDFVQAMQRAVYVASTGYGLGDNIGIAGTEAIMTILADELVQGDIAAGLALVNAKQTYLNSLSAMTVYDEKSSIQATLYGLPMYRVQVPGVGGVSPATVQSLAGEPTAETLELTIEDGGVPTTSYYALEDVTTDDGSYFTADGDAQATAGRAVQPRVVLPIPSDPAGPVHGVLLEAGTFTDLADRDPLISLPTDEWVLEAAEPQICFPSFWPSEVATVNTAEVGGEIVQTLVITPGQFRCTSGAAPTVTGMQRLYTGLSFKLLRSWSEDTVPPVISSIDLRGGGDGTVEATVEVSDLSGIASIVVHLVGADGSVTATSLDLSEPFPLAGSFTVSVTGVGEDDALMIAAVGADGEVATATAKGANLSLIQVDAGPDQVYAPGIPTTFRATVAGFTDLTPPVSFIWDFGDGTTLASVLLPDEVDEFGNGIFTVEHTYSAETPSLVTASLKVTDAAGGIGVDDVVLMLRCDPTGDAVSPSGDLIGCSVDNDQTTLTVSLRADGPISDDFQYRVQLDIGNFNPKTKTFDQPPDGDPDVHLRYYRGDVTGLPGLRAEVEGNDLRFIVGLADLGVTTGDQIKSLAQTQAGVPSEPETGIVDTMPDSGFFGYVLR